MRKTLAVAIAISAMACEKPHSIAPTSLRGTIAIRWEGLNEISNPSEFAQLEPILEKLGGKEPVPAEKVYFVSKEKLEGICGTTAKYGGCYAFGKIAFDHNAGVSMWLHEQGHHFDKHLTKDNCDEWIDELEAFAFQLYAYEHIAKNYDRDFGVQGVVSRVFRMDFLLRSSDVFDAGGCHDRHSAGRIAVVPLFALGFGSFGEFWNYVHTSSHSQIRSDYKATTGWMNEGRKNISRIILDLEGQDRYFEPVERFFGSLSFGHYDKRSEDVMYAGRYGASFGRKRIIIHDSEFSLSCAVDNGKFEAELYYLGKHLHIDLDGGVNMRIANPPFDSGWDYEVRNSPAEAGRYLNAFRSVFRRFVTGMKAEGFGEDAETARKRVDQVFSGVPGSS